MATSRAPARQVRPKNRRDLILEAAAQLFGERGFHSVGIDDIGRSVGVTGPAVYRHFANKEEIVMAAIERNLQRMLEGMTQAIADAAGEEALGRIVERMIASELQDWDFAVVWRRESRGLPRDRLDEVQPVRRQIVDLLVDAYAAAVPGLSDVDRRARLAAHHGIVSGVLLHGTKTERRRHRALITTSALHVLSLEQVAPVVPRDPALSPIGEVRRSSRREIVLSAAAEQFAQRGFRAVGIDEAAAAAGIAGPTVYRHFEGKEALLVESLQRLGSLIDVHLASVFRQIRPEEEQLRELVRGMAEIAHVAPDFFVTFFYEGHNVSGPERDRYEQTLGRMFEDWEDLLRRVRPDLTAPAARTLVHGAAGAFFTVAGAQDLRPYDHRAMLQDVVLGVLLEVQP